MPALRAKGNLARKAGERFTSGVCLLPKGVSLFRLSAVHPFFHQVNKPVAASCIFI